MNFGDSGIIKIKTSAQHKFGRPQIMRNRRHGLNVKSRMSMSKLQSWFIVTNAKVGKSSPTTEYIIEAVKRSVALNKYKNTHKILNEDLTRHYYSCSVFSVMKLSQVSKGRRRSAGNTRMQKFKFML